MQVGSTVPRAERFGPAIPSVEGRKDHVLLCSSLFQHKAELSGEIFWNSSQAQMLPFAEFLSSCWCKLISNKIHKGPRFARWVSNRHVEKGTLVQNVHNCLLWGRPVRHESTLDSMQSFSCSRGSCCMLEMSSRHVSCFSGFDVQVILVCVC